MREYLQYKILEIIFGTNQAAKLSFLGGTAIRMLHGNKRFSEDLDFDNFGLKEKEFENLATELHKKLKMEGYNVEIKNGSSTFVVDLNYNRFKSTTNVEVFRDERT